LEAFTRVFVFIVPVAFPYCGLQSLVEGDGEKAWREKDLEKEGEGVEKADCGRAAEVGAVAAAEGWVMTFVTRGMSVQKTVCHDTVDEAAVVVNYIQRF
jgi:hypothetical protein